MSDAPDAKTSSPEATALQGVLSDPLSLEDLEDAAGLVPTIDAQSFVRMSRILQEESRLDLLLPYATPDQLTSLIDIDAWTNERVDLGRAQLWILEIAQLHSAHSETRGSLGDLMYSMDPEMWTLVLVPRMHVYTVDSEDDASRDEHHDRMATLRTWDTPDGFFVVGVPDDEFGQRSLSLLDLIYRDDLAEGRKLMLSVQSAIGSQVEEDLLRWRSGRLADLGFVAWEEAMQLFRAYDHHAAATQEPRDFEHADEADTPGLTIPQWDTAGLLNRVMGKLDNAEHGRRAREFLLLVNEVMAAQRFPPGDDALQARAIDQTQATLSLGLEMLLTGSQGHPSPDAFLAERVQAIGLRAIFRVGYGALERLRTAVTSLTRSAPVSMGRPGSLLDRPWGLAIAALGRWYPELPDPAKSDKTRPLRSFADVRLATTWLAEAGAFAALSVHSDGFGVDPVWITRCDAPETMTLGDLVRTAVIHARLPGARAALAPLTPSDVDWAHKNLLVQGRLLPEIHSDFAARCAALGLEAHEPALEAAILTRLTVELAGVEYRDEVVDLTKTGGLLTVQHVSLWLQARTGVTN